MIDIIRAKKAFAEYVKNYDIKNDKIRLKVEHIERVARTAKKLATKLELEDEDIKLAELIGLLHDIGRFEQLKRYNTFIDRNSINHGEFGVHVLFNKRDGIIRNFIKDNQYDKIIKTAILNHNKDSIAIPDDLTPRELLHTKIIRDSDKIDILNLLTFEKKETAWEKADLSDDIISDEIYKEFMEERRINYGHRKSSADILVSHFAYVFDFNFPESLEIVKEKNYFEKIYERFEFNNKETMEKYKKIYKEVVEHIEKALDKK
mgnify:CR=1 FL=1